MKNKLQITNPAFHKGKNPIWMLLVVVIIIFIGCGNQEVKAQERIKIEVTDSKTVSDSTSIKPRKGTKNFIGSVYDENSNPLPGATISIKNVKNNSNTDSNGAFSIKAKKGDIIVFSYIGYKDFEFKLKNETSIKVYLENDSQAMGEVVKIKFKKE